MDKQNTPRPVRWQEHSKTIVILLLLCSALFLLWEAQLLVGFSGALSPSATTTPLTTENLQVQAEAARPLAMAVITEGADGMYGVTYDDQALSTLFQSAAPLLQEVLGSAAAPVQITARQWEIALSAAPGVYFQLAGTPPLSVLASWMSGEETSALDAAPQRLVFSTTRSGAGTLCYQDWDGLFYACQIPALDFRRLSQLAESYPSNGAIFAFQSNQYDNISPYTLLSSTVPTPAIYQASAPLGSDGYDNLLPLLNFDHHNSSIYTASDGVVVRTGTDTLRIDQGTTLSYDGELGLSLYPVTSASGILSHFDMAEACRRLLAPLITNYGGEVQLHLLSISQTEQGTQVDFGYALNGVLVQFPTGPVGASFQIQGDEIANFTIYLRNYVATEDRPLLLPQIQAAAALAAAGHEGSSLQLGYYDGGANPLTPQWVAGN